MNTEQLVSRNWPDNLDRRHAAALDGDVTVPARRKEDWQMSNTLIRQDFKAGGRRFSGDSVTGFGDSL